MPAKITIKSCLAGIILVNIYYLNGHFHSTKASMAS